MGSVAAVLFDCRGSGDYGFYVFTDLSALPTVSDGHIFLCLKKDMEERQTKGLQSRPLESGFYTGDMICRISASRFRIGAPPEF